MSASSKKKLRAEQNAVKLTERQMKEKKEARKVRIYTIAFVVVLVALIAVAAFAGISQKITSSGIRERNTTALTLGEHSVSNAQLNYYYMDTVNNYYSQNNAYLAMSGLDVTKPLNEQYISEDTTWADFFLESAKQSARAVYALCDAAAANGFTLTEEQEANVKSLADTMKTYASSYGYQNAEGYLKAFYGNGADMDGFMEYNRMNTLANEYQTHYTDSLTFDDQALRDREAENYGKYSSFSYNQYFLSCNNFLTGGTTDEDGSTTYTTEERNQAAAAAEEIAKTLITDEITTVEEFDNAIAALEVNNGSSAQSTAYTDTLYSNVSSYVADWVADSSRAAGDKSYVPSTYKSTDEDGNDVTITSGYYVVFFNSANDNKFVRPNVRHILVGFEGGTKDENGATVYSDEEKAAAKTKAEELLAQWKSGEATEESFAALATENTTDPGSKDNGGLYENITPGQMVPAFNDWCFDSTRAAGDTGIVETEYGFHVMYFSGKSAMTYRDSMITNELKNEAVSEWYTTLTESMTMTDGDTTYIRKDLVLNANGN